MNCRHGMEYRATTSIDTLILAYRCLTVILQVVVKRTPKQYTLRFEVWVSVATTLIEPYLIIYYSKRDVRRSMNTMGSARTCKDASASSYVFHMKWQRSRHEPCSSHLLCNLAHVTSCLSIGVSSYFMG